MDFFNIITIDPLWIALACGVLCIGGVIVVVILPLLGTAFDLIGGIFDIVSNVIQGGPVMWCGCLILLIACPICGVLIYSFSQIVASCGTPDAVNFCRLF